MEGFKRIYASRSRQVCAGVAHQMLQHDTNKAAYRVEVWEKVGAVQPSLVNSQDHISWQCLEVLVIFIYKFALCPRATYTESIQYYVSEIILPL